MDACPSAAIPAGVTQITVQNSNLYGSKTVHERLACGFAWAAGGAAGGIAHRTTINGSALCAALAGTERD